MLVSGCGSVRWGAEESPSQFSDILVVEAKEGDTFSSMSGKYLKDPSWAQLLAEYSETESLKPGQPVLILPKIDKKGGLDLRGYQTVPVLSYHHFSSTESNRMTVSQAMFERQMRLLQEKGYRVVSMDQFFDFLDFKFSLPPKAVVITIDDGWRSAYEIAFPILKKYGYPTTLFIYTDVILDNSKNLSWGMLHEMAKQGIGIQCHTKSHRNLIVQGKNQSFKDYFDNLEKELSVPKDLIQKKLDREVKYLAYPYGDTSPLVIELAKKLGYRGAFTIKRGGNPFFIDNYQIKRSAIYGDYSLVQFEKNLVTFHKEPLR